MRKVFKIAKVFKYKLTQKAIREAIDEIEDSICIAYLDRAFTYAESKLAELVSRLVSGTETPNIFQGDRLPETNNSTVEEFPCAS